MTFHADVFDAEFNESTSSFRFGTWKTDSFFLLTIEPQCDPQPRYTPRNFDWKRRTSIIDDPNGTVSPSLKPDQGAAWRR